jgi:hypothetical protein
LAGARVQLSSERGVESTLSNEDGRFQFFLVLPGRYTLRAELFQRQPATGEIIVSAGGRHEVDLVLEEAIADEIVVTAEAPLVNSYDVSGGATLSSEALETTIGTSLRFTSFIAQLPGAHDDQFSQRAYGNVPIIEGVNGFRQIYFVDGVDVSLPRTGGSNTLHLPATAVHELKVETTGAGVEYSRTIGSYVSAVTKSGTNSFHGHLSYQPINAAWAEEQDRFPAVAPDEVHHNWEASLGGPMVRDRLWFYGFLSEYDWPNAIVLADGETVMDKVNEARVRLFKIDWRPSARHSLTVGFTESPVDAATWPDNAADLHVVSILDGGADLTNLRWSWAIRDDVLLEAHLAVAAMDQVISPFVPFDTDPECAHDQPCGNSWTYFPFDGDFLIHNGTITFEGFGTVALPRDQGNASLNFFVGRHDLKAGLDLQRTAYEMSGVVPPLCRGYLGYSADAPGGFGLPSFCVFFPTKESWQDGYGPVKVEQENGALYLRDRFAVGRWRFNLGVRVDQQHHANDVDETVLESTELAPRFGATYDFNGDGRLLLTASAGRYISHMPQGWSSFFTVEPAARRHFDLYFWDWSTQGYGIYVGHTAGTQQPVPVEPDRKDEFTVGVDWQFVPDWVFRARAVYWERSNFADIVDQVHGTGEQAELVQVVQNTPGAGSVRRALNLSVQRRYRNNWTLLAAYTWSRTEGNCEWYDLFGCIDKLGAHEHFVDPGSGVPWSRVNRRGRLPEDRPHNFKVSGSYLLGLGRGHSLDMSAFVFVQSGAPWQPVEWLNEPEFDMQVARYLEPRGSRRNRTEHRLNMSIGWSFPISKSFSGQILGEIINATNAQGLIGTAGLAEDGEPYPTSRNYQPPRFYRITATVRF